MIEIPSLNAHIASLVSRKIELERSFKQCFDYEMGALGLGTRFDLLVLGVAEIAFRTVLSLSPGTQALRMHLPPK